MKRKVFSLALQQLIVVVVVIIIISSSSSRMHSFSFFCSQAVFKAYAVTRRAVLVTSSNVLRLFSCVCLIVQELCESRGGRPGLSVLTSLLVSVGVKLY